MKQQNYILFSLGLSLVLHLLLLCFFSNYQFTQPIKTILKENRESVTPLTVLSPAALKKMLDDASRRGAPTEYSVGSAEDGTGAVGDPRIKAILAEQQVIPQPPKPTIQYKGVAGGIMQIDVPQKLAQTPVQAPRPKIAEIDVERISPSRMENRQLTPKDKRSDIPYLQLPSLLPPGDELAGVGGTYGINLRVAAPVVSLPEIPNDLQVEEKVLLPPVPAPAKGIVVTPGKGQPSPFDTFVSVKMYKQEARRGGGHFMIVVQANEDSEIIQELPKDALFIIDRSTSISFEKLDQFKNAVSQALEYLNPSDRFNIVTFNDQPQQFATGYLPATLQNKIRARDYLGNIRRFGTTDVFAGINPYVKRSNGQKYRPLNIFLLTDGNSTVNIFRDSDFLQKITGTNPGNVSIHTFSAGDDANKDLLNFLAFLNQGYTAHVKTVKETQDAVRGFVSGLSTLLLSDMQHIFPEAYAKNIYPKKLPHLYRKMPLRIYGQYGPKDKVIIMTIKARGVNGREWDLVLPIKIQECRHTKENIALQWAGQKILHLLADRALSNDTKEQKRLSREIEYLQRLYNIALSY